MTTRQMSSTTSTVTKPQSRHVTNHPKSVLPPATTVGSNMSNRALSPSSPTDGASNGLEMRTIYYIVGGVAGGLILLIIFICCICKRRRAQQLKEDEMKRINSERNRSSSWHWEAHRRIKASASDELKVPPSSYVEVTTTTEDASRPLGTDVEANMEPHLPSPGYTSTCSEPYGHTEVQRQASGSSSSAVYTVPDSPMRDRMDTGLSNQSITPSIRQLFREESPGRESMLEKQVFEAILAEERKSVGRKSPLALYRRPCNLDKDDAPIKASHRQSWGGKSKVSSSSQRSRNKVSRDNSRNSSKSFHCVNAVTRHTSHGSKDYNAVNVADLYAMSHKKPPLPPSAKEAKRSPSPVTPTSTNITPSSSFSITSNPAYDQQQHQDSTRSKVTSNAKEQYLDYANLESDDDNTVDNKAYVTHVGHVHPTASF